MDLARAKSEALVNICSLLMLGGDCNKNSQNNLVSPISEKTTLHVQHTLFVHFFAVVLHDFNVKLPENS